jgi:eukaryotic-like serine/threonine-protein kinase
MINSPVMSFFKKAAETTSGPGPFGRYYLQELINTGGMAEIWLATDSNGKAYALRRLHERLRFNFDARRRFNRGAEILAKIQDHANIIGYVEHGKAQGRLYLVMEYIEAANLKELYAQHDPVLLENVAQILLDMAAGLDHMHSNGYMHLDFKPENVLITRNASVRLVDFDLAEPIPESPRKASKKNPGTPAYMAPEQLLGHPISHRVDIFSYGVAAYELLTNQKPFPGDSPGEILSKEIDRSGFVAPRQYNPDMPATLEKVILRCLEQEPERRYPFIGVMFRELQTALYV